jgi:hypothetical protein
MPNSNVIFIESRPCAKVIDKSITISFNFDFNFWASLHDYWPTFAESVARHDLKLLSAKAGVLTNKSHFHKHNAPEEKEKRGYYELDTASNHPYPSYLDYIFSNKKGRDLLIESIIWETLCEINGVRHWDQTLTHMAVYSDFQSSKLVRLVKQDLTDNYIEGNLAYHRGEWRYNKFSDDLLQLNKKFIDELGKFDETLYVDSEVTTKEQLIFGVTYVVTGITSASDYVVVTTSAGTHTYGINDSMFIAPLQAHIVDIELHGLAKIKTFKNWFEKSNFITKFVAIRAYYDNVEQCKLSLLNISVNGKTLV